jgi:hypothetical protein
MSMSMADVATVTPELEAACRKLLEGVQLGGPYFRRRTIACACSSPAITAG